MDEIIHIITYVKRCRYLVLTQDSRHAIKYAYKRTCTTYFVMSPNFTGAIKELRTIKDDLSLSHPEQSINTLG
jgi:hypothetical protein